MLSVSGELERTAGGPAIRDINTKRRTLYVMSIRSDRTGYGPLFDMPDSTNIVDQRTVSTVAPQALYMLNNPFVLGRSAALATRILSEGPTGSEARIRRLYLLLYGRQPEESEVRIGESIVRETATGSGRSTERERWTEYCQILLAANEFMVVD